MNLQQLKFFVTVAQYEHVSKAAEALNISQPALSSAVKKLEQELGLPLFQRNGRNIRLNAYGQLFLEQIAPGIRQIDKAVQMTQELRQTQENKLTIVAPPLSSFPSLMSTLRKDFPDLTIQNVDCPYDKIYQKLIQDEIDLCVLARPIYTEGIARVNLTEDELVMLVPEGHRLAGRESVRLIEFADDQFTDYPKVAAIQSERDALCQKAGFHSRVICEGRTLYDLIDAVRYSSCVALLPRRVLERYRLEGTRIVPISEPRCTASLYLYWKQRGSERLAAYQARTAIIRYFEHYRQQDQGAS